MEIIYAYALLLLALVFFFTEIFMPSAGFLTALGLAAAAGGGVFAFQYSATFGTIFIVSALPLIIITVIIAFKLLPYSPLIRGAELRTEDGNVGTQQNIVAVVGDEGVALTQLRPVGVAKFGEEKLDVVAEDRVIEKSEKVKILEIEGNRICVRKVE